MPLPVKRASAPKACCVACAHMAVPPQSSAKATGRASSTRRVVRERRRSSRPHAASVATPMAPVREALSITTQTNNTASTAAISR